MSFTEPLPASVNRLPIVGVMGSGIAAHDALAEIAGQTIAVSGCHLLTGGGGGVMAGAARAFCETPGRAGQSIGIIRAAAAPALDSHSGLRVCEPRAAPNPWVEIPIFTHLPDSGALGKALTSRNHLNVLTPDLIVALPGGAGTLSEVELALEYGRPLILFGDGASIGGREAVDIAAESGDAAMVANDRAALETLLESVLWP